MATVAFTVAVWLLPALSAIVVGVAAMVVIAGLVPVLVGPLDVAVTVYTAPTVVPVVKVIVATPLALVCAGLGTPNDPPVPDLEKVTQSPGVATGLSYWSASCAVMVTGEPTGGL